MAQRDSLRSLRMSCSLERVLLRAKDSVSCSCTVEAKVERRFIGEAEQDVVSKWVAFMSSACPPRASAVPVDIAATNCHDHQKLHTALFW